MAGTVYLLGSGIGQSLSPAIHRAAFAAANLDWQYKLLDTNPANLAQAMERIRDSRGANVTAPFKQKVLPLLDQVDTEAASLGAVNTIVVRKGELWGYNTDLTGLERDFQRLKIAPQGPVLVAGAGGAAAAALRLIAQDIPTFEQLGLPPVIESFADMQQGLILFTGPTGSGKSTTLAALINQINDTRACHVITLEDPIEFLHPHKMAVINQREVGKDTRSFSAALRSALRQDPDVILVGEMRDTDTISTAITAAETGHLVLATLHTSNTPGAVDRIIDSFPGHQQQQIRTQLADTLRAVVAQRLVPKRNETGRVVACEVLVGTSGVRNLIREGKIHQVPTLLETGSKFGMQTFEQSLKRLQDMGLIDATSF